VINKCINGNEENFQLFRFLYSAILELESSETHFSLAYFLLRFSDLNGCSPAFETFEKGRSLDAESGLFQDRSDGNSQIADASEYIYHLWKNEGKNDGRKNDIVNAQATDLLIEHLSFHLNQSLRTDTIRLLRSISGK
jgi:hypothetical protein